MKKWIFAAAMLAAFLFEAAQGTTVLRMTLDDLTSGPTDLSQSLTWPASGTTYELFTGGLANDLEKKTIVFTP